jgi:GNAT superfamily N-acetyltransferase
MTFCAMGPARKPAVTRPNAAASAARGKRSRAAKAASVKAAGEKPRIVPARRKSTAPSSTGAELRVLPVTNKTWPDFETLFSARGAPHYCWCTPYRRRDAQSMSSDEKRAAMHDLVRARTPIGVLAYDGDAPVGWCSVAPRETYVKLERSRTMPRVSPGPTWTVLCFFVQRPRRRSGVTRALLAGALEFARANGAEVVEGYPYDTAGISATHRGSSHVFRALGFQREGSRWFHRVDDSQR